MESKDGTWIMYGVSEDDPECLHTVDELIGYIEEVGFLPLFRNEIPGFSVEERTTEKYWWSEDPQRDPWVWREIIARRGDIAYGKFFHNKAGFISKKWFPYFANYRRSGYDFDARWDDELASFRQKKIMDLFMDDRIDEESDAEFAAEKPESLYDTELFSFDIKKLAGFGKDGEKGFEGTMTQLQMQTYLCACDFRKRVNKKGAEYGWNVAVYSMPEKLWGYDHVTSAYGESPEESWERIAKHMDDIYPIATEKQIKKVLK